MFGTRQETVDALLRHGRRGATRCGRCRCGRGYDDDIASKVADINNASASAFAGAIIGALFLRRFVTQHARTGCTSTCSPGIPKERPGGPVGAEAHAVRALFAMLAERYG